MASRSSRPAVAFAALVALSACVASSAAAQDALSDDAAERRVERARTLFTDGVALVAEHRHAEAEALFRSALELRDAPAIRYNLASVLFEQGEYPEARALADAVVDDPTTPEAVRAHARELVTQMDARAGHARFELAGGEAEVAVDGYAVPDLSREVPLAPGAHVATASRGTGEVARAELEIATGEHRVVSLDVSEPEATPPEEPVAPPPSDAELHEQWWFWTAIGGGVVVVAIIVGIVAATTIGTEEPIQGDFDPALLRW